jgi:long-chain fatty acid transport protein
MKKIASLALVLAFAGNAAAAGFRLSIQDAKANGMGGAYTAVADGPAAVWYNPAVMGKAEGTNVALGSVMEAPFMQHENTNGTIDRVENKTHFPPHFYATRKINDKFAVGLGVNVPFGLSSDWDKVNAATRKVATYSMLQAVNTNLSGSYKVSECLSVGAGASYVMLDAEMNKKIEGGGDNIEQTLKGDGTGMGYNLAANYKWNKFDFAANYHSKVAVDVDGKINLPTVALAGLVPPANNKDASTKITLPDIFQFGAAYRLNEKWLFSAEADYTNWSTYRRLIIDYTRDNGTAGQSIDNKNWKSVWAFRAGTEYKVNDTWKARAGAFYDNNPVKEAYFETRIPDSDRLGLSVGGGYAKGNLVVDASFTYVKFMERTIHNSLLDDAIAGATTSLNGKYNASALLPAITVGYKF